MTDEQKKQINEALHKATIKLSIAVCHIGNSLNDIYANEGQTLRDALEELQFKQEKKINDIKKTNYRDLEYKHKRSFK